VTVAGGEASRGRAASCSGEAEDGSRLVVWRRGTRQQYYDKVRQVAHRKRSAAIPGRDRSLVTVARCLHTSAQLVASRGEYISQLEEEQRQLQSEVISSVSF
jgi:hypothetical protein